MTYTSISHPYTGIKNTDCGSPWLPRQRTNKNLWLATTGKSSHWCHSFTKQYFWDLFIETGIARKPSLVISCALPGRWNLDYYEVFPRWKLITVDQRRRYSFSHWLPLSRSNEGQSKHLEKQSIGSACTLLNRVSREELIASCVTVYFWVISFEQANHWIVRYCIAASGVLSVIHISAYCMKGPILEVSCIAQVTPQLWKFLQDRVLCSFHR